MITLVGLAPLSVQVEAVKHERWALTTTALYKLSLYPQDPQTIYKKENLSAQHHTTLQLEGMSE